jgi:hypothetical protein
MSLRTRLILPAILSSLAVLAGCGSGTSNPVVTPPPSGTFSNSNFNGTYTFSVAGVDGSGIFSMAGSLVACGCSQGTISSGTVDVLDPATPTSGAAIGSNSVYSISADGRGSARLFYTPVGGSVSEIDVDFVLSSSSHGLVTRFDSSGTGSGTIDLQPSAVTQSSLAATPYAFMISGADNTNKSLATVGALTLNSSGTITAGIEDFNFSGTPTTKLPLSGSVTVGSGTSPGNATLTTTFGTFTFDVYAIDANHLKVIESDGKAVFVGDLLSQATASVPAGNLVFTMSGLDNLGHIFATGGLMVSDGASLITSGSEDVNDAGIVDNGTTTPLAFTGSFSDSGGGRFELDLSNYVGGSVFAAYPSSGGLLMLEMDTLNGGVTGGVATTQATGATVAASQGYGLNLSGEDVSSGGEVDEIAEFKTTSTGITGIVDQNDGGTSTGNMTGTYSLGSGGLGSATFTQGGFQSMFFYSVDNSLALFISTDPTQAALGSFELQTTPTNNAHLSVGRAGTLPMPLVLPRMRAGSKNNKSSFQNTK